MENEVKDMSRMQLEIDVAQNDGNDHATRSIFRHV